MYDRGEPATPDFTESTLTGDGMPHDLDLSGIVPAGAKVIILRCGLSAVIPNANFTVCKESGLNPINMDAVFAQVNGVQEFRTLWTFCQINRHIGYQATFDPLTDFLAVSVAAWIL